MTDQILAQNNEVLLISLDATIKEIVERALSHAQEFIARVRADLAAVEGQIDQIAPHPRNNMSGAQYKQAQARRASIVAICDISGDRFYGQIATISDRKASLYCGEVALAAAASCRAWINKLIAKIGPKAIASANVTGSLWTGSTLRVTFEDGSAEVWTTKCIVNVSSLGKLFNQWPTRKVG
jgi:hypothetical protein